MASILCKSMGKTSSSTKILFSDSMYFSAIVILPASNKSSTKFNGLAFGLLSEAQIPSNGSERFRLLY